MKKHAKPSPCLEKQKETIDRSERIFFKRILSRSEQDVNLKPCSQAKSFKKMQHEQITQMVLKTSGSKTENVLMVNKCVNTFLESKRNTL